MVNKNGVISLYLKGWQVRDIAHIYKITASEVRKILKDNKVKLRGKVIFDGNQV